MPSAGWGSSGFWAIRATRAIISATPALSSAPSSVVPSVQTRSSPTRLLSAGSFAGVIAILCPSTSPQTKSPPVYVTMWGFTPAPGATSVVSRWAIRPRAGRCSQPLLAATRAVTYAFSLTRTFAAPNDSSSLESTFARSNCFLDDGTWSQCSSDEVVSIWT